MIITVWIVSLLILVASVYFVYRMLKTSSDYLPSERSFLFRIFSSRVPSHTEYTHSLSLLHTKIQSLENANAHYEVQIANLQMHVQESATVPNFDKDENFALSSGINPAGKEEEEEDWEELYYLENEQKVQLENELDRALQELEAATNKLNSPADSAKELESLQNEIQAFRLIDDKKTREIEALQEQLNASVEKEQALQKLLDKESRFNTYYQKIEAENVRLREQLREVQNTQSASPAPSKETKLHTERTKEFLHHLERYEAEKRKKLSELNARIAGNKLFVTD